MKKMATSIALCTLLLAGTTYAAVNQAGSKEDPLVTKSYVDKQIAAMGGSSSSTSHLAEQIKAQQDLLDILLEQVSGLQSGTTSGAKYELVTIPQGSSIIGEQSSEMILRGGRGKIVGSANGGVQDVTDGVDLQHGVAAPKYHLMIIPRTEGRGIFAETEIIVMVRGGYTIQ
ncbi:MAG: hypothetical protein ACRCWY_09465 [Cellulosilyticaceae bacterium]